MLSSISYINLSYYYNSEIYYNAKKESIQNYIFLTSDFYVFSDSSFIVMSTWSYLKDEFGVSLISVLDFCYFKVDSNKNFQWSTSIDFLNNYEERQSIYEYNGIIYIAIVTSRYYFCLQTLDKNTGVVNNSQCAYLNKDLNTVFDAVQSPLCLIPCEFGRILVFEFLYKKIYVKTMSLN